MSNRAIRRAAERQANKAAKPTAAQNNTLAVQAQTDAAPPCGTTCTGRPETISDAQLAANRANSQLSTGPKSAQGKRVSSHNALKTGLTGRTIVLPTDDVAAYQSLVTLINQKFAPANDYERHLVQTIADTEWRLLRIPTLEAGLYALGRTELAAEVAQEPDPQLRASMLEAHIFRTYQKDLRNLALQERRLRSQLKQTTAELQQLQQERREASDATQKEQSSQTKTAPAVPNGFEFSTPPTHSTHEHFPASEPAEPDQANFKSEAVAA